MLRPFRVTKKVQESQTIRSFYLEPADGQAIDDYQPGQYITLRLTLPGRVEPVLRSYTLSAAPGQSFYRITIKREGSVTEPGLVSGFLHDQVEVGDILSVAAPKGNFILSAVSRRPVVLLSGGVGITPMLSMIETIAQEPNPRFVWFLHSSLNEQVQPMGQRLRKLALVHPHIRMHIHHSQPTPWETPGQEYDAIGQLDLAFLRSYLLDHDADFYLCGPAGFMEALYDGLRTWGVPDEHIFYEYFGEGKSLSPSPRADFSNSLATTFRVELARSGQVLRWQNSTDSLLDLLEANAIYLPNNCRQGTCMTCSTGLVSGQVRYKPEPLAEPFEGDILVCCARPESDLVLDL
ncbi:2Fe-2S iron-sulfur cluster-binding protein [Spirosoma arcticum]